MGKPTRGNYFLDLVVTDAGGAAAVLPSRNTNDHRIVRVTVRVSLPQGHTIAYKGWYFAKVDWSGLLCYLSAVDWGPSFESNSVDVMAQGFTNFLVDACKQFIQYGEFEDLLLLITSLAQ